MDKLTVLVTGATGKQGGRVARLLLERGHRVHALTRHADSRAARHLEKMGAQIVVGDMDDKASLERAVAGVDAVFAMGTPYEAGPDAEIRQGINLIDAIKIHDKYTVYTSVGSADQDTGIPHFESKWVVEKRIKELGLKASVIGPVYFMENLLMWGLDQLRQGMFAMPLPPDCKLQQIALDSVGEFAVMALENQDQFAGKRIDIASDEVSGVEVAEILSNTVGEPISYQEVPMEMIRQNSEDLALMYEWFISTGYSVDIEALRREYPQITWKTYADWASEQDWNAMLSEQQSQVEA